MFILFKFHTIRTNDDQSHTALSQLSLSLIRIDRPAEGHVRTLTKHVTFQYVLKCIIPAALNRYSRIYLSFGELGEGAILAQWGIAG